MLIKTNEGEIQVEKDDVLQIEAAPSLNPPLWIIHTKDGKALQLEGDEITKHTREIMDILRYLED